jgi:hypothetical protein
MRKLPSALEDARAVRPVPPYDPDVNCSCVDGCPARSIQHLPVNRPRPARSARCGSALRVGSKTGDDGDD